ncbi:MAG: IS630 family transposase [Candidatus Viridilinea halotolerans]|uniref:IS630 family transposase n=1 Tax=Candidatus Viridilinea halotolerans TaxID=2491704 RepID=A0A426U7R7_9CHLR|nr:MAG: IS630 family transposase [Candidatus Viridilinea halotolerans]
MAHQLRRKKGLLGPQGRLYFVDAAHLLHQAVPSQGWIKRNRTVELKTNTGRSRLNVLGAYSPDDHSLVAIEDTISCDAQMVCQLLQKLRAAHPGLPILVVLDNARYQRAGRVQDLAKELEITLLFLPPYSPNLNLIERFWKFLRKHVTRNRFYATFGEFRTAIQHVLKHLDDYTGELASLMTEKFHLFGQTT